MTPKQETHATASSEAIFGSAARGDSDVLSDRDILIVDDDPLVLRARTRTLANEGWSVAPYTFAKLNALAECGALFVQHLKLESSVITDNNDRLGEILKAFSPKKCYASELKDNSKLALLSEHVPSGPRGILLAADILYVTVRNFGVLKLAERDIHAYSFESIIHHLEDEGIIDIGGARHLASLRFLKCLYRSGESSIRHKSVKTVERAVAVLPKQYFPSRVRLIDPDSILGSSKPPAKSSAYFQLRDLERRYVALQAKGLLNLQDPKMRKLLRWIENPRAYAFNSQRLGPKMRIALQNANRATDNRKLQRTRRA